MTAQIFILAVWFLSIWSILKIHHRGDKRWKRIETALTGTGCFDLVAAHSFCSTGNLSASGWVLMSTSGVYSLSRMVRHSFSCIELPASNLKPACWPAPPSLPTPAHASHLRQFTSQIVRQIDEDKLGLFCLHVLMIDFAFLVFFCFVLFFFSGWKTTNVIGHSKAVRPYWSNQRSHRRVPTSEDEVATQIVPTALQHEGFGRVGGDMFSMQNVASLIPWHEVQAGKKTFSAYDSGWLR